MTFSDEQLLDYVLDLLEPGAAEEVEAACAADAELAARVEALRAEQDALAGALEPFAAPADLEERLVGALREQPLTPSERRFRWGRVLAVAAALLLATLVGLRSYRADAPRRQLIQRARLSELHALGLAPQEEDS